MVWWPVRGGKCAESARQKCEKRRKNRGLGFRKSQKASRPENREAFCFTPGYLSFLLALPFESSDLLKVWL